MAYYYIPFSPRDSDVLETADGLTFNVKYNHTSFDIILYQNSAEVNRVDKTNYLTSVGSLFGALRTECSIIRPSIIVEQETLPSFNYVYIGAFGRYYFVTGITSVAYKMWRIELNTDVLMTYKNKIVLLNGVIGRQEEDFNPLLIDNELPTQNNPIVEVIDIPSDVFNTTQKGQVHCYIMSTISPARA